MTDSDAIKTLTAAVSAKPAGRIPDLRGVFDAPKAPVENRSFHDCVYTYRCPLCDGLVGPTRPKRQ